MSSFICAISGVQPEVPVVSPASGEIFEKRLIIEYIQENGTDPVNGQKLDVVQLIELKQDVHALPKSLDIAGPSKGVESSAGQTEGFELSAGPSESFESSTDVEMQSEEQELPGLSVEHLKKIKTKSKEISTARKWRSKALLESRAPVEAVEKYAMLACHETLHSGSVTGITSLDLQESLILTGGMDKTVVLFDLTLESIETTFKGHEDSINSVILHSNQKICISGAQDSQVRIWSKGEPKARHVIHVHNDAITDISLHPTGDFVLSTSEDSHWSLTDLVTGGAIVKVKSGDEDVGICCCQFHPNGIMFGIGAKDSVVKIWDSRKRVNVADLCGHRAVVRAISFSENGDYMATGADDGEVKIWDLRKNMETQTIIEPTEIPINALTFDQSGAYLAVAGGNNVQVFQEENWSKIVQLEGHSEKVTGVRFSENASQIVSTSLDKTLRVWGMPWETNKWPEEAGIL